MQGGLFTESIMSSNQGSRGSSMAISDSARVLRQRWYVLLVGFLLTAGATYAVFASVPVPQQSTGLALLLEPPTARAPNPYLSFDSALNTTAESLARAVSADPVLLDRLRTEFSASKYTVAGDSLSGLPFLAVTVESTAGSDAANGARGLIFQTMTAQLDQMQANVSAPPASRVVMTVVAKSDHTQPVRKTLLQLGLAVAAVGLAVTFTVPFLLEFSRKRRNGTRDEHPDLDDPVEGWSDSGQFTSARA
ncbi:MAG TPA: hypothetical protein VIM19_05430 [Actinomycetes bacterium]